MRRRRFLKMVGTGVVLCGLSRGENIGLESKSEICSKEEWLDCSGKVFLGGLQMARIMGQKQRTIELAERLSREAAGKGAQIIMTGEVGLWGFGDGKEVNKIAETIPGPTTDRFGKLAKELHVYLMLGMLEKSGGQLYNSMGVIGKDGEVMGVMRKVHLPKGETSEGLRNGSEFPVWDFVTATGKLTGGIMICYDRELPESARILMLKGADVIFNPLCCNCPTRDNHRCLLRTRAFENDAYLFMVNQAAPEVNGHSMAIDFKGNILKETGEGQEILIAEFDLDALSKDRIDNIYGFYYRRPEVYGLLCDKRGQIHPWPSNLPPGQGYNLETKNKS